MSGLQEPDTCMMKKNQALGHSRISLTLTHTLSHKISAHKRPSLAPLACGNGSVKCPCAAALGSSDYDNAVLVPRCSAECSFLLWSWHRGWKTTFRSYRVRAKVALSPPPDGTTPCLEVIQ